MCYVMKKDNSLTQTLERWGGCFIPEKVLFLKKASEV